MVVAHCFPRINIPTIGIIFGVQVIVIIAVSVTIIVSLARYARFSQSINTSMTSYIADDRARRATRIALISSVFYTTILGFGVSYVTWMTCSGLSATDVINHGFNKVGNKIEFVVAIVDPIIYFTNGMNWNRCNRRNRVNFMPQTALDVYAVAGMMRHSADVGQVVGMSTRFAPREATMLHVRNVNEFNSSSSSSSVEQIRMRMDGSNRESED